MGKTFEITAQGVKNEKESGSIIVKTYGKECF